MRRRAARPSTAPRHARWEMNSGSVERRARRLLCVLLGSCGATEAPLQPQDSLPLPTWDSSMRPSTIPGGTTNHTTPFSTSSVICWTGTWRVVTDSPCRQTGRTAPTTTTTTTTTAQQMLLLAACITGEFTALKCHSNIAHLPFICTSTSRQHDQHDSTVGTPDKGLHPVGKCVAWCSLTRGQLFAEKRRTHVFHAAGSSGKPHSNLEKQACSQALELPYRPQCSHRYMEAGTLRSMLWSAVPALP